MRDTISPSKCPKSSNADAASPSATVKKSEYFLDYNKSRKDLENLLNYVDDNSKQIRFFRRHPQMKTFLFKQKPYNQIALNVKNPTQQEKVCLGKMRKL